MEDQFPSIRETKVYRNKPVLSNENDFTHHCKGFDSYLHVGSSTHYFNEHGITLGIVICDNSNPRNNEYIIFE
jgi:hypothetical protein